VIPARGGSKRIPGKNIRDFAGRPVIAYAIEAASATGVFEEVIVSTDSDEIAAVAEAAGASVPFRRPAELAGDEAGTAPVLLHALEELRNSRGGRDPEFLCAIYPATPLITAARLLEGYELIRASRAPTVLTVGPFPSPILRALGVDASGRVARLWPEYEMTRSQDLAPAYFDAGQFYWLDVGRFEEEREILMEGARPLILSKGEAVDIDDEADWELAERLFQVC
jgi:pseudaminic acid cytidylyltransferase